MPKDIREERDQDEEVQTRKIICWPSPGCVEMCGLTATVKDGRLIGLKGTKDYPTPHKGPPPLHDGHHGLGSLGLHGRHLGL